MVSPVPEESSPPYRRPALAGDRSVRQLVGDLQLVDRVEHSSTRFPSARHDPYRPSAVRLADLQVDRPGPTSEKTSEPPRMAGDRHLSLVRDLGHVPHAASRISIARSNRARTSCLVRLDSSFQMVRQPVPAISSRNSTSALSSASLGKIPFPKARAPTAQHASYVCWPHSFFSRNSRPRRMNCGSSLGPLTTGPPDPHG